LFACLSGLWASLPEIKIDDDDDDYSASRRHSGDVMVGNRVDINRDFLIKIKKSVFLNLNRIFYFKSDFSHKNLFQL